VAGSKTTPSRAHRRRCASACAVAAAAVFVSAHTSLPLTLRGHPQHVYVYGPPDGSPIVVSSGDGGWLHLAPHVAAMLAARGYHVVGVDVRMYLESFTSGRSMLRVEDEPGDYRALMHAAAGNGSKKAILVGVSEGAGLSVLAAADAASQPAILGVVGVGLPDRNELGWRWRDAITYLTHRLPDEPTFSTAAVIAKVAPIPIAAIHSTHDEYVPLAEIERVLQRAASPTRLWVINASDHRFSDNLAEFDLKLIESMRWIEANAPR
jgi:pimeloyl-ACP methyl ester carboxylesterase